MRIGVFGGSFDPIHIGHLIVAEAAADQLELDLVRFIPAWEQPFKVGALAASGPDRLEMMRLALSGHKRFILDTTEIDRRGVSYTLDTLIALRDQFPQDELFLLIGADAARSFPSWHHVEGIPELAHVVAMSRAHDPAPKHELIDRCITVPSIEISAEEIRRRHATGRSIRYRVPHGVLDYIEARGLYASEEECSKQSSLRSSAPDSTAN